MKFRKKVIYTMIFALVPAAIIITVFASVELYNIEKQTLNVAKVESSNQALLYGVSEIAVSDLDEKMSDVESEIKISKSYLESVYSRDLSVNLEDYDDQLVVLRNDVNREDVSSELKQISGVKKLIYDIEENRNDMDIFYSTQSGITLYGKDTKNFALTTNTDMTSRPWYVNALNNSEGGICWTNSYQDFETQEQVLTCSTAVRDQNGHIKGVVAADINIEQFFNQVNNDSKNLIAYMFLAKSDGTFLIGDDGILVQDYVGDSALGKINNFIINSDGQAQMAIDDDLVFTGTFTKHSDLFIGIIVSKSKISNEVSNLRMAIVDRDPAYNSVKKIVLTSSFVIVLSVLISISVTLRSTKRTLNPLETLSDGVKEIGEGNLDYRIEVETNDEIGALADSFNDMTEKLKSYIKDLSDVTAYKEQIGTELRIARVIQSSMLPDLAEEFPHNKNFDVSATMIPAKEVGGDFFDCFLIDESHLGFIVADVSGKGIPASLFMAVTKSLIRDNLLNTKDPAKSLKNTNNQLVSNNKANMFVTAFVAILNIETGNLEYSCAGHNPPLVYSTECKKYEYIKPLPNFVLAALEDQEYINENLIMQKGDRILCYTDGVTEAMDLHSNLYTEKRLKQTLNETIDKVTNLDDVIKFIEDDLDKFSEGVNQADDITMIMIELK